MLMASVQAVNALEFNANGTTLHLHGTIVQGDAFTLKRNLIRHPDVKWITLNSGGGNLTTGQELTNQKMV